mmetsp:Transcript_29020/g.67280  ORF Transcript_29020/g.67280 Transcript_29020/m.67280 type:complete len:478 (-) Transcript_29020:414-1847(-)
MYNNAMRSWERAVSAETANLSAFLTVPRLPIWAPPTLCEVTGVPVTPVQPLPEPCGSLEDPQDGENVKLALSALSLPFRVTSVSYEGLFVSNELVSVDLEQVPPLFGVRGSVHTFEDNLFEMFDISMKLSNFVVLKFSCAGLHLSLKLYHTRYFQVFGLGDTVQPNGEPLLALAAAELVVRFIMSKLNELEGQRFSHVNQLKMMAMSAFHPGVSEVGMCFNVPALEPVLQAHVKTQPEMAVTRNDRNHSLVLRLGQKLGSQLFHGTGTTQLMGTRVPPEEVLSRLRALVVANPKIVMRTEKKRKRRAVAVHARAAPVQPVLPAPKPTKRRRKATPCTATPESALESALSDEALMAQLDVLMNTEATAQPTTAHLPSTCCSEDALPPTPPPDDACSLEDLLGVGDSHAAAVVPPSTVGSPVDLLEIMDLEEDEGLDARCPSDDESGGLGLFSFEAEQFSFEAAQSLTVSKSWSFDGLF